MAKLQSLVSLAHPSRNPHHEAPNSTNDLLRQGRHAFKHRLHLSRKTSSITITCLVSGTTPRKTSTAMQNPPFQDVFPIENMDVLLPCWFSGVELQSGKADSDFSPLFVPRSCTEIAIALGVVRGDLGCLPRKGGTVHCWVKEAMKPGNLEARLEEQNVLYRITPKR